MIRNSWLAYAVGLAVLIGCGGPDPELLGEPAPLTPAEVRNAEPEEVANEITEAPLAPADSLAMFDDLRFYGSWYELYPYGMVWRPVVVADWAPMVYGHWVWSSYGWMWVSYDPFGWAVYNYGFWVNDFTLGWVWVPDYAWEPVRCEWTWWDDTICWAPLPPPGIHYGDPWDNRGDPWVAVPLPKFKNTDIVRARITPKYKSGTTDRTLRRAAPDVNVIERGTGRTIKVVDMQLDRSMVGSRELTRVVLPTQEQAIVDEHRAQSRTKVKVPPSSGSKSGDTGGNVDDSQSKGKSSPPPAKKETPPKFKEKEAEKSKGDKKDDGKSKTGEKKDGGKG